MTQTVSSSGSGAASADGDDAAGLTWSGAAGRSQSVEDGSGPDATRLEDARARLAMVDELPVSERAQLLAAVNELIVTELAAMDEGSGPELPRPQAGLDEGGEGGLGLPGEGRRPGGREDARPPARLDEA